MIKHIYARVTTDADHFIVEYTTNKSDDKIVTPYDSDAIGYIVKDVGNVAISKEAYEFLKQVKRGGDETCKIEILKYENDRYSFSTLGGIYFLADINKLRCGVNHFLPPIEAFQLIENISVNGIKADQW